MGRPNRARVTFTLIRQVSAADIADKFRRITDRLHCHLGWSALFTVGYRLATGQSPRLRPVPDLHVQENDIYGLDPAFWCCVANRNEKALHTALGSQPPPRSKQAIDPI